MTDPQASLAQTLAKSGQSDADLGTVGATILRTPRAESLPGLPSVSLALSGEASPDADLIPGEELGRGGMGVVQLARQRSLEREVAIKTARTRGDGVGQALVREGRIMGAVEHPNVVPVHALGVDGQGLPLLVMKRVEGTSWRELLNTPAHPGWAPLLLGHQDRLRAHIEILIQVCRALAFAHDRGVVHRDLKPDNVMIGRFGEVYLLDWGIALRLNERDTEPVSIVGTPGYLAPEMAYGDPKAIDARADVYLLGATLYEILSGRVPHDAPDSRRALILAVSGQTPPLPADAPSDLAALVRVAMAPKVDERLGSAELFREGLARFLVSRQAEVVAADARAALERADQAIAAEGPASSEGFRALVEARFGFASAHRMRPQDDGLRAQQEAVLRKLIERELALRSPSAARALIGELSTAPEDLMQRVEELEARVATERDAAGELEKHRAQADSSPMVGPMKVMAVFFTLASVGFGVWFFSGARDATRVKTAVMIDVGMVLVLGAVFLWLRPKLLATRASRQTSIAGFLWVVGVTLGDLVGSVSGLEIPQVVAFAMTCGLIGAALVWTLVLPDLWPAVLVQAGVVTGSVAWPEHAPKLALFASVTNVGIFIWAVMQQAKRTRVSPWRAAR